MTRLYHHIISGRAGVWASPVRGGLSLLEKVFVAGQELLYSNDVAEDKAGRADSVAIPVISVGNITVGGTGKTPLVIDLLRRLLDRGYEPAVVARGYRARPGELGDELTMISHMLPTVRCVAEPDRVVGCDRAAEAGADVVVLDDGFRHRSVARVLDIVVIDATNPFGYGHRLPRGLLRESPDSLKRADLLVISRADLVSANALDRIRDELRSYAPQAVSVTCRHRPIGLSDVTGRACEERYGRAVVFAALGNPDAFAATVRQMGIEPVACRWFRDHHHYRARDVAELAKLRASVAHDVVLTTRKDAVKLRELTVSAILPLRVVDIVIEYLDDGEAVIDRLLGDWPRRAH